MVDWEPLLQRAADFAFIAISFIIKWAVYPVIALMLYRLGQTIFEYVNSLWVSGRPNEWVVIMRDGNFKQAGIGLSTFVGPFDQVAIFPSKLTKVEIKTQ